MTVLKGGNKKGRERYAGGFCCIFGLQYKGLHAGLGHWNVLCGFPKTFV
jgi:hypothetical protein